MAIRIIRKGAAKTPPAVAPPQVPYPADHKRARVGTLDAVCVQAIEDAPNTIVSWFLIASYVYYVHHFSVLSDELYDTLTRKMKVDWEAIEHQHKDLITPEDLDAGTLFRLKALEYPEIARQAAARMCRESWGVVIDPAQDS